MWIKAENGDLLNLDRFDRVGIWQSEKGPAVRAQIYGSEAVTLKSFADAEGQPPAMDQARQALDVIQADMKKQHQWIDVEPPAPAVTTITGGRTARGRVKNDYA